MTQGIITKVGNSYAIRVPKSYIDDNNLKLGDIINIEEPLKEQQRALDALIDRSEKHGSIDDINNLVAWQRDQRDWDVLPVGRQS